MRVAILGAGAMGSALTVPLAENGVEINLWGTEYDIDMLERISRGEEHPRIKAKLPEVNIFYPDKLKDALEDVDVVLLAVSTAGVLPIFERIKGSAYEVLITISKGLLEVDGRVLTIPQALCSISPGLKVVAITGPSIAREVANKMPTRVVFNCEDVETAEKTARFFRTFYYAVEVSDDVIGSELAAALKNVYSIGISWLRGYAKRFEMNNAKGVLVVQALKEIAAIAEAMGGKAETVYGLSGVGDVISTFKGGRNGMLGELLGKGLSVEEALDELRKRGVGVIEGYETAKKAYKLIKDLEKEGKSKDFPMLEAINSVLYENKKVEDVLKSIL
jgi:glycerol-3-phosphate dehydrogenase (NAD(P)+)